MVTTVRYSGDGRVYMAPLDEDGDQTNGFQEMGNCPELVIKTSVNRIESMEKQTGQNLIDAIIERNKKVEVDITLQSIAAVNLVQYFYANSADVAAGAILDEEHKAYTGKYALLKNPKVTEFTALHNGAEIPVNYTVDTDYRVNAGDRAKGRIYFPSGTTISDGTKVYANYKTAAGLTINAFNRTNMEMALSFVGLNAANRDKKVRIELFRVRFDPLADFPMIGDDFNAYKLSGTCIYDENHDEAGGLMRATFEV